MEKGEVVIEYQLDAVGRPAIERLAAGAEDSGRVPLNARISKDASARS